MLVNLCTETTRVIFSYFSARRTAFAVHDRDAYVYVDQVPAGLINGTFSQGVLVN